MPEEITITTSEEPETTATTFEAETLVQSTEAKAAAQTAQTDAAEALAATEALAESTAATNGAILAQLQSLTEANQALLEANQLLAEQVSNLQDTTQTTTQDVLVPNAADAAEEAESTEATATDEETESDLPSKNAGPLQKLFMGTPPIFRKA